MRKGEGEVEDVCARGNKEKRSKRVCSWPRRAVTVDETRERAKGGN